MHFKSPSFGIMLFFRHSIIEVSTPARQLCEELEAMAEHNVLEALTCEIIMNCIDDFIGTIIQNVGEVLYGAQSAQKLNTHIYIHTVSRVS